MTDPLTISLVIGGVVVLGALVLRGQRTDDGNRNVNLNLNGGGGNAGGGNNGGNAGNGNHLTDDAQRVAATNTAVGHTRPNNQQTRGRATTFQSLNGGFTMTDEEWGRAQVEHNYPVIVVNHDVEHTTNRRRENHPEVAAEGRQTQRAQTSPAQGGGGQAQTPTAQTAQNPPAHAGQAQTPPTQGGGQAQTPTAARAGQGQAGQTTPAQGRRGQAAQTTPAQAGQTQTPPAQGGSQGP